MSASDSHPDRSSKKSDGSDNPFVAFRRFADAQVSSFVDNVFQGLGIFQQSNHDRRQREIDDFESQATRNTSLSQDQSERRLQEARRVSSLYARAIREAAADDETSPTRVDCEDDSDETYEGMRCPYRPPEQKYGLLDQMLRPSPLDVYYVFHSEYSPIALERQELFREHSGKMRAAFADLVAVQEGEGLLPDNTIEKNTQRSPFCWAVDMVRMINLGRSSPLGGILDRKLPDGQSIEPHILRLLATRPFFYAEQDEELKRQKEADDAEAEYVSQAPEKARVLMSLSGALGRFEDQNRGENTSDEEKQDFSLKIRELSDSAQNDADDNDAGPKSVVDWAANFLPFEPGIEPDDADDNYGGCACFHCCNYERRRDEYRQWRREELEELDDTDVDEERTTNPTSELDQYHALADFQAQILKVVQQRTPPESAAMTAAPSGSSKMKNEDDKQLREQTPSSVMPSILSTLTTTEQRTLPDGTVTTKVVLKKRFSDGAEEVTERVHTQNAPSPSPSPSPSSLVSPGGSTSGKVQAGTAKQKKEGGWFWS